MSRRRWCGGRGPSTQISTSARQTPTTCRSMTHSFDVVVSNFGVLHFADPERFFTEAGRVLRPGGRLAFTVWAQTDDSIFAIAANAVAAHGVAVTLPDGPPFFRFSDRDECVRTLGSLRYRRSRSRHRRCRGTSPRRRPSTTRCTTASYGRRRRCAIDLPDCQAAIRDAMAARSAPTHMAMAIAFQPTCTRGRHTRLGAGASLNRDHLADCTVPEERSSAERTAGVRCPAAGVLGRGGRRDSASYPDAPRSARPARATVGVRRRAERPRHGPDTRLRLVTRASTDLPERDVILIL